MPDYICPPVSDVGPNDYSPTPSAPHYANVDEDPHDSDATILSTIGGMEVWTIDPSAIPAGSRVTSLKIRSVQKESTAGPNTYRVGLRVAGADYMQANHVMSAGSGFVTTNDVIGVDPTTGQEWSLPSLAGLLLIHEQISITQGLPRPHLTECIVIVTAIPQPHQPIATEVAIAGAASVAGIAPDSSAVIIAGTVSGVGIAPESPPSIKDKRTADVSAIAPSSIPVPLDPTATPSAP